MTAIALLALAAAIVFLVISIREHARRMRLQGQVDSLGGLDQARATLARTSAELQTAKRQLVETERALDVYEVGLYRNHYSYDTSDEYRRRLDAVREEQKRLVTEDAAARWQKGWTIGGDVREGEKMIRQQVRLMLRAFNGECDAAVAKVRWDNVSAMEERIRRAFASVNKTGEVTRTEITGPYLDSRLAELRLAHEHAEKVQEEREEQRAIKEQMREEERARKELEKAQEEAERDERRSAEALEKAREQLERSSGAAQAALEEKVRALELRLAEAHTQKERAISRAQQTRSGHVYVISNIGSFGEGIFKIGMTRRLDPMDRVKELGDASVPFEFDVHAIVWSDDAPGLECELHQHFAERRVNLVNCKKEFFRVSIDDIEAFAARKRLELKLTKLAEAREWRETAARQPARAGAVVEHGVQVTA